MKPIDPPRVRAARKRGDSIIKLNGGYYKVMAASHKAIEVRPLGWWDRLRAFVVSLLTATIAGCGGAAFVYGIDPGPDAGPEASVESGIDAPPLGHPMPEAGVESGDEAVAEAGIETSIEAGEEGSIEASTIPTEAGPDSDHPDSAAICTPIATTTKVCGSNNQLIEDPAQWCWITGFGGPAPQGNLESTRPECQCLETYNCACVLASLKTPSCGGVGDPTTARCSDGAGFPVVQCP